jgi:hypothetical protein
MGVMAAEQTESEVARVSEAETYRNTTQYKTKSEIAIRAGASSVYAQHDVTVGRLIVEHVVKPLALVHAQSSHTHAVDECYLRESEHGAAQDPKMRGGTPS